MRRMKIMKNSSSIRNILSIICTVMVLSAVIWLIKPLSVAAANPKNEINAYETFLKQRHDLNCQGISTVAFSVDSFLIFDIDGDGRFELLVADSNICPNRKNCPGHTHILLYKYERKAVQLIEGVLVKQGNQKSVYISTAYSKVIIQTYSRWVRLDIYGNYDAYTSKPSMSLYKKYSFYKNTEKNRKKYLEKAQKKLDLVNKYQKKIDEYQLKFEKLKKTMNDKGIKIFKNVSDSYDSLKTESIDNLNKNFKTLLASDLPDSAEKVLLKVFTDTIQETLVSKPSSYNDCKTAAQLVNRVASQMTKNDGAFTFTDKKITYRVIFNSTGTTGAGFVSGTITSSLGITYNFGGTVVNKAYVKEDLDNLKKYSDKKIEEAKKEVYDETGKILLPDSLKKYLKATSKSQLYKTIAKKSPEAAQIVKKGITSIDKFNAIKKGIEGLKSIDIKNTSEDKIVKKFTEYDKKVLEYQKAIEDLF